VQERRGRLRARISAPLQPCDTRQDRAVVRGVTDFVVWAYSAGDFE
jgi:hypothetical protein